MRHYARCLVKALEAWSCLLDIPICRHDTHGLSAPSSHPAWREGWHQHLFSVSTRVLTVRCRDW